MLKNQFNMIGRITKDPVLSVNKHDKEEILFTLAQTLWGDSLYFDCILHKQQLLQYLLKYCSKGCLIAIEGMVVPKSYQDASGNYQKKLLIYVKDLCILQTPHRVDQQEIKQSIGVPGEYLLQDETI